MKKINKKAENMSENQSMAIVCNGLAEVCDNLANTTKEEKGGKRRFKDKCPCCKRVRIIKRNVSAFDYPKTFRERADIFRKLDNLYNSLKNMEETKNDKSRR